MEAWKENLIKEQEELKERLVKLIEFMNSEKYFSFDDSTKAVYSKQRAGMELYLSALNIRVFGDPKKYSNSSDLMALFYMTVLNGNAFTPSKSPEMERLEKLMEEIPIKDKDNE